MTSTKEHPEYLEEPPHLKVPRTVENWRACFNHPSGSTIGLFTAIVNIGGFSALFFSPYIADFYGRRIATAIGIIILVVSVIIQSVPSVNEGMFIGRRFLVGFGSNISIGAGPLLIMELAYPQHRGRLTVMYISLCEGFEILVKYHASGNRDDPFVRAEFAEIQETIKLEKARGGDGVDGILPDTGKPQETDAHCAHVVLLSMFRFSYYLHDILSSVGIDEPNSQSLFNGGLQIWSFLVAICFSVYFVEKLGRRILFLIAAVGMLVVLSVWTRCSAVYAQTGNKDAGPAVLAMIFLFYGVADFAWPGLTVAYCSEILPFSIRAKGLAMCLGVTALSGVLNQYGNPIGLSSLAWKFCFVYVVILVIEVVCIWFLFVETKGPTLEEIAVLFDGKDAKVSKEAGIDGDATFEQVEVRKAVEKV
ncbi:lactose permease [Colletotrichum salicis]|uniref:Lactose permease n=1 Tax=Colletotrichum salicis TaxID=1209931 RepID=A0A135V5M4_9PEZI|nr:lactose permease [Colletotrichum salicis]